MSRRDTGQAGEALARRVLEERGYIIIETNYRCAGGEIDIIARDGETLVFVEVRAKKSRAFGSPEESITPAKMTKLRQTAARYQQERENLPASARIDVVAIELDRANRPLRVAVIENAIGEC